MNDKQTPHNVPNEDQVVFTNKARCRDCYRCVRVCPVKAIRVENGQAAVDPSRCIACGTCVRECPQKAKAVRNDLHIAREIMAGKRPVAVSIAPSFAAFFADWERVRLPSALRRLGFSHVAETASGAWHVAHDTAKYVEKHPDQVCYSSACPAFVKCVEMYYPDQVEKLVPVVSPMLAHASIIRNTFDKDAAVIFIGPCVAKKAEADESEGTFRIDCALTFLELRSWLKEENIDLASCEESPFDETPGGDARLFPIEGGSLRTAGIVCDLAEAESLAISGPDEVKDLLEKPVPEKVRVVEPLFCHKGCIQGPAGSRDCGVVGAREDLLHYASEAGTGPTPEDAGDMQIDYKANPVDREQFSEERIREVLAHSGKLTREDELNCGACGYNTCREKAIAVLRGLAEPEMCIPYMRLQAEQRSDLIVETSPNGIILLDAQLIIVSINPAMKRMFCCSDALLGQHVSRLLDPQPFENALAQPGKVIDNTVRDDRYNLVYRHLIYSMTGNEQIAGIFMNLTEGTQSREALKHLQAETLLQAQELLEHQVKMAQTLTRLLGESTAQGEMLVNKIMEQATSSSTTKNGRDDKQSRGGRPWSTGI